MEHNITILHRTSTPALCALIFAACSILLRRAYLCTVHGLKVAAKWLISRHNFTPGDEEEPVIMTGYQYIIFAAVVCLACVILSINLD